MNNKTLVLKSGKNTTFFELTPKIINQIEYFNFLEYCNTDDEIIIELEYPMYIACISDLASVLNIESNNYLSIIRDPIYYVKNKNVDMINYFLNKNMLALSDILNISCDLNILLNINHVPSLLLLYFFFGGMSNLLFLPNRFIRKYDAKVINDCGIIEISYLDTKQVLYKIDLETCPELATKILSFSGNDILVVYYDFQVQFLKIKSDSYEFLKVNFYSGYDFNLYNNRYYYSNTNGLIELYDLDEDKYYSVKSQGIRLDTDKNIQKKIMVLLKQNNSI